MWNWFKQTSGFWFGLAITLICCGLKLAQGDGTYQDRLKVLQNLDNAWTDLKFNIRGGPTTDEEKKAFQKDAHVVIVAIDEKSLRMKDLGMWPWPHAQIAKLVEQLNKCGAKAIGFDVVFAEPDSSRTLPVLEDLKKKFEQAKEKDEKFGSQLEQSIEEAQGSKKFAGVLENSENVVLGYFFFLPGELEQLSEEDRNDAMIDSKEYATIDSQTFEQKSRVLLDAAGMRRNIDVLSEANDQAGFFNFIPDIDGMFRKPPMVFRFHKNLFPSLSLQMLAVYFNQPFFLEDSKPGPLGELDKNRFSIEFGPRFATRNTESDLQREGRQEGSSPSFITRSLFTVASIPLEAGSYFRVNFYGQKETFLHVSAGDIIHEDPKSCAEVNNKMILIGATSTGVYDLRPTPLDGSYPGVEIHATVIENVITGNLMVRPQFGQWYEAAFMLLLGGFLSWMLTRFRLTTGMLVTIFILGCLFVGDYLFLFKNGIQSRLIMPVIHLAALFVVIAVYRYATEERKKKEIKNAFQFYLSKSVVESVLKDTSKLKLGGERRELTVLFSDIRGFTTISERLAPEALTELLNEYLTPMTDLVFKYDGTLDKYMGDAIMAIFGAPIFYPHHPKAACETALDMMEELDKLRQGWKERGLPQLDIGIGINTGPMSVGNMGSKTRFDYTVLGDNVNLGSRLEGLNKQYGTHIVISQFTFEQVKNDFTTRELDAVIVKGKQEPVRTYELIHRGPPDAAKDGRLADYGEALNAYKSRRFDEAIERFGRVLQATPADGACRMYIERCQQMKAHPPGPDWDGVFKMTSK